MAVNISKIDVWSGAMPDRSGGLAEKIEAVSEAGADLEFVITRQTPDVRGAALVFLAPLHGAAQIRAAKAAGLEKALNVHTLRLEGPNQPGFGAKITRAVADAGINMRGLSGTGLGRRCAIYLAFDNKADTEKARRVLKKIFAAK